ncbi:MAG TPA: hypothetical protein VIT68_03165 [Candidatus Gracilibacteria bacterium]
MKAYLPLIINILLLLMGFFIGQTSNKNTETHESIKPLQTIREISVIQLQERISDQLKINISGPVRLVLNDQTIQKEGDHLIPLGQIPGGEDLKFEAFPYTGNAKTMKFYPSTSQFARGTKYQYRRFFPSKKAALEAGFIASKLVK